MKKSLQDIPSVITSHAVGEKRVLLSRGESGCNLTQIAVTDLRAGEVALAHIHPDMQEGFYVLEGELEVTLSGDEGGSEHVELCHKDDFVYVESGTAHELHAITNVRVMIIGCEIQSKKNSSTHWSSSQTCTPSYGAAHTSSHGSRCPKMATLSASYGKCLLSRQAHPSLTTAGWAGMSLIDVISKLPTEILGRSIAQKYNSQLPLLVKFIDAPKDLTIQVHPDDRIIPLCWLQGATLPRGIQTYRIYDYNRPGMEGRPRQVRLLRHHYV